MKKMMNKDQKKLPSMESLSIKGESERAYLRVLAFHAFGAVNLLGISYGQFDE